MTYEETLHYIFHKLPMFTRMGSAAYKKDLTNTVLLCEHLGNPQHQFKSIHVAGTNGKGSVSHMLAAIFQTCGFKTGLYTSPHLYDFRERIKVDGEPVSKAYVVHFIEQVKPLIEKLEPSFFEITVAMAFQFFAQQNVDIAIIEVGLGGRLDSTNVILPELSVITNIGWDHMNLLGDSLQKIAAEKAGIIKENIPVVIGETLPQTKPVFTAIAGDKLAPVYWAEDMFQETSHCNLPSSLAIDYRSANGEAVSVETDLQGIYQVQNVRTVLTAVKALTEANWRLPQEKVRQALQNVKGLTGLGGRWEVIRHKPAIVLEVAHNEAGMEKMLAHLSEINFSALHIIIGMVRDKEVEKVLQHLPTNATYYFTQATIPRALPALELQQIAAAVGLTGTCYTAVNEALKAALQNAKEDDLLIVCGSIFLVAEVDKSQYVN